MTSDADLQATAPWKGLLAGALVFGLTIVALLPFANKALYFDEPVYFESARHIVDSPFDPYGFQMNWSGKPQFVYEFHRDPPGASYAIAAAGALLGWSEPVLHVYLAVIAGLAGLGAYCLARELCTRPLVAVALAAASPVFYVCATNVASDMLFTACYVWAIWFWVRGLRGGSSWCYAGSMLCASAALLTKYFGVSLIPLLFAYTLAARRRADWTLACLLAPLFVLFAYEAACHRLYGTSLFIDAAKFATSAAWRGSPDPILARVTVALIVLGGSYVATLLFAPALWSRRAVYWGAWGIVFACGVFVMAGGIGRFPFDFQSSYNWPAVLHAGVFTVAGVHVLVVASLQLWKRHDADTVLIALWIGGTILFAALLDWSVNARAFLPMAPAVGMLIARQLPDAVAWPKYAFPTAAGAAIAFCIAYGDFYGAEAQRRAAIKFGRDNDAYSGVYSYRGGDGFEFYAQRAGLRPWSDETNAAAGDRVIVPQNRPIVARFHPDIARAWDDLRYNTPAATWVTTMQPAVGAGFYDHHWGPLPYAFTRVPEEEYAVYELGDFRHLPPPGSGGGQR